MVAPLLLLLLCEVDPGSPPLLVVVTLPLAGMIVELGVDGCDAVDAAAALELP